MRKTIYEILHTPTGRVRLVRAANSPRAQRHVSADTLKASVPTPDRLIELVKAGVEVEDEGVYLSAKPEKAPASISGLVGTFTPAMPYATPQLADVHDGSEPD